MITVRNVNKSGLKEYTNKYWLKYWEEKCFINASRCMACGCKKKNNLIGAHVQKETSADTWYVIPLCEEHGETIGNLNICNNTKFVPVNEFEQWIKKEMPYSFH